MIRVETISANLGTRPVLSRVSFDLAPGTLNALIGPNGAGKSTLLRVLAGILPVSAGRITLDGQDIATLKPAARARRVAWLPQSRPVAWNLRVEDLVALGRFNGRALTYAGAAPDDRRAIDAALSKTGADAFIGRPVESLSGGELARVHLARVFASSAPVLLLDEPAAALDLRHQIDLIATLKSEAESGRTIVFSAHDLTLVRETRGRTLVLQEGRLVAEGPARQIPDANILREVFGVEARNSGFFTPAI